jgi:hypothetical protein
MKARSVFFIVALYALMLIVMVSNMGWGNSFGLLCALFWPIVIFGVVPRLFGIKGGGDLDYGGYTYRYCFRYGSRFGGKRE